MFSLSFSSPFLIFLFFHRLRMGRLSMVVVIKCIEKGTEGRVETYTEELSGCTDIVYITHRDMHACVTLNSACPLTVSVGSKWEKKRWAAQSRLAEKRCLAAQTSDSSRQNMGKSMQTRSLSNWPIIAYWKSRQRSSLPNWPMDEHEFIDFFY